MVLTPRKEDESQSFERMGSMDPPAIISYRGKEGFALWYEFGQVILFYSEGLIGKLVGIAGLITNS